jgi:hypothetical protein
MTGSALHGNCPAGDFLEVGRMNRDDVLVWISLAWFVGLCGLAIWYFLSP